MLVGVISDTHDRLDCVKAAVKLFKDRGVGAIVHAGDFVAPFAARIFSQSGLATHAVLGNNDGERAGLATIFPGISHGPLDIILDGRRIVVIHDMKRIDAAAYKGAHVLVHGHTHNPEIRRESGLLVLNPGEACGWLTGRMTAALLDTRTLEAQILDIVA